MNARVRAALDSILDVWPWIVGALVAMALLFWLTDTVLGTREPGHTGTIIGKLYTPPYTEPGYTTFDKDSKGNLEPHFHQPVYHPAQYDVRLVLDTAADGARGYSVSSSLFMSVHEGSVLRLACRRGFYTRHLYCLP